MKLHAQSTPVVGTSCGKEKLFHYSPLPQRRTEIRPGQAADDWDAWLLAGLLTASILGELIFFAGIVATLRGLI